MAERKRSIHISLSEKAQNALSEIGEGSKSRFISSLIEAYADAEKEKGSMAKFFILEGDFALRFGGKDATG